VKAIPPLRLTGIMSFLIEFLAAIPSIAFGFWGLFKLKPFLDHIEACAELLLHIDSRFEMAGLGSGLDGQRYALRRADSWAS